MQLVFVSPDFQEAVALTGNYLKILDSFRDFMERKQIEDNLDLLWGNYADWQIYVKADADPHLRFYGNIDKVFTTMFNKFKTVNNS